MEEKKMVELPVWSEEQWETWLYSFVREMENSVPQYSSLPDDIPTNQVPARE